MSSGSKSNIRTVLEILASIATIIGLCIAVIALIPAFGQWLLPKSPLPTNPTEVPTATVSALDVNGISNKVTETSIALTETFTPPSVVQPIPTRVIERGDTYSIVLRAPTSQESGGGLRVKMLVGGQPSARTFMITEAVPDVVSGWTPGDFNGYFFENDFSNTNPVYMEPGMYALVGYTAGSDLIFGMWGNGHKENILGAFQSIDSYLVFPIEKGLVTEIVLNFAFLEVGVIQNGQAADGVHVEPLCPKSDVAGNQILYQCKGGEVTMSTEAGGYISFVITPGKYVIELDKFQYIDKYHEAVEIPSFEKVKLVINVP